MHLAICKAAFDDYRTPEDGTGCGSQVGWGGALYALYDAACVWLYAGPLTTITSGCTRSKRLQFGAQAPVTWDWLFDFGCPDTRLQNRVIFLGSTVF